ncbi:MAG TPA: hypothetical protein VEJ63_22290 [Planctomycetota bacterium]|nr:hypothetical protein [Planctomycetota bacterium]
MSQLVNSGKTNDPSSRQSRSQRLTSVLNSRPKKDTPLGNDTAWALKLKDAVNTAVRELNVEVHAAQPVLSESTSDHADMVFELDTNRGRLKAVRSRQGTHAFEWM